MNMKSHKGARKPTDISMSINDKFWDILEASL